MSYGAAQPFSSFSTLAERVWIPYLILRTSQIYSNLLLHVPSCTTDFHFYGIWLNYKVTNTLISKDTVNNRSILLMKIKSNTLYKIWSKKTHLIWHLKDQIILPLFYSIEENWVLHKQNTTCLNQRQKWLSCLNRWRKTLWQNFTFLW